MNTRKNFLISLFLVFALFFAACAPQAAPTESAQTEAPEVTQAVVESETPTETQPVQTEAPAGETKITVIFPKHEADLTGAFEARVREFEKQTGIKVDLIQSDWDSIADRVIPEMATGGSAYDVVEFDNGWVAEWCGAGWTTPLDEFMPAGYTDGMIPGLVDLFTCPDGKVHGLVWNNDTRFFYYNAQKLSEAGIEAPPKTWDEFVQQSLTAKEKVLSNLAWRLSGTKNGLWGTSFTSGLMPLVVRSSMTKDVSSSTRILTHWRRWNL